jgi:hypothetical protein
MVSPNALEVPDLGLARSSPPGSRVLLARASAAALSRRSTCPGFRMIAERRSTRRSTVLPVGPVAKLLCRIIQVTDPKPFLLSRELFGVIVGRCQFMCQIRHFSLH